MFPLSDYTENLKHMLNDKVRLYFQKDLNLVELKLVGRFITLIEMIPISLETSMCDINDQGKQECIISALKRWFGSNFDLVSFPP